MSDPVGVEALTTLGGSPIDGVMTGGYRRKSRGSRKSRKSRKSSRRVKSKKSKSPRRKTGRRGKGKSRK